MSAKPISLTRYLIQEQHAGHINADLRLLIEVVARACKSISTAVGKGALGGVLGEAGTGNIQGEAQKKLDVLSNEILLEANEWGGHLAGVASEEMEHSQAIPNAYPKGNYLLLFDPLDGSSNIDVNVPVGTIFSVVRKITRGSRGEMEDMLQPGRRQVAAGYVIYGSSTMLVYTTGQGAHGFTLDPSIGEFLLSHPDIRIPTVGRYLSVNDSYERLWEEDVRALMRRYRGLDGERKPMSVRYVGSLVADFHRNLLGGGVFAYPANERNKRGKLRLLYEANPLAFIVEQAGGAATDGGQRILDIDPTDLHQRTPLYIGSKSDIEIALGMLAGAVTTKRPLAAL
jgi:fructose-1,6-bisphosphatase I